jgi:four helix bundle protein
LSEATKIKDRMRALAVGVVKLSQELPRNHTGWTLGNQILRSATSVGPNYRAACRARSRREFVAKLGIVEEEADETLYWFDILAESGLVTTERIAGLRREADQLLAITVASIRTARMARRANPQSAIRNPQ